MQRRSVLIMLFPAILFVTACGSRPGSKVIGRWETVEKRGGGMVCEFFPDGTVRMQVSGGWFGKTERAGKFSFIDNQHLRLELGGGDIQVWDVVQITPEQLQMRVQGELLTLARVKEEAQGVRAEPAGQPQRSRSNAERSHLAANQASAVGSLRTINTAEITYASTYNAGYSPTLISLGPGCSPPSATRANLIDDVLASGTKSWYRFTYTPGPIVGNRIDTYTVSADPVTPGETGANHYFTDQSGVIRQESSGPAGPHSAPLAG